MNYDSMSVEKLLDAIEEDSFVGYPRDPKKVSALRKAVIREASVGEVTVKIVEYEDELTASVGSPHRIVTCSEQIVSQAWVPEGKYNLVLKEEISHER